ncbi:protein of unknown function (plasmid) [Candidatus Methylocalor cossyra]|uniref:Transposase n=1 Tax=Candidatus Methylocalor cossyra TaxID=3108543 RepID=A0ABP1CCW4_9GAMM
MKAFSDEHRDAYGVEPICQVLPIAPATYRLQAARQAAPTRRLRLAALEQALYARQPFGPGRFIHHRDRGAPYVSIRYTGRLAEAEAASYRQVTESAMAA